MTARFVRSNIRFPDGLDQAGRAAMCEGKAVLTWASAKAVLDRDKGNGRKRVAYRCPVCRGWHLGKPEGSRKWVRRTVKIGGTT